MPTELRPFHQNYDHLAALIQDAWAGNVEQPLLYTPAFLASLYEHPDFDLGFSPTFYDGEQLVGSMTSLPRQALFDGQMLRLQVYSLLTVAPSHRGAALGISLWQEHCRHGIASASDGTANDGTAYDGTVGFCVEGDKWNTVFPSLARMVKMPTWHIASIPYMARVFRPGRDTFQLVEAASKDSQPTLEIFLAAAKLVATPPNSLIRHWTPEQAAWQCLHRAGAVCATFSSHTRCGAISGYRSSTMGPNQVSCVLIDDLLWGDLEPAEALELLDRFLSICFHQGVQMVITPLLPYAKKAPLEARSFRRTRRLLHCYYTSWTGRGPTGPVDSLYLDVF